MTGIFLSTFAGPRSGIQSSVGDRAPGPLGGILFPTEQLPDVDASPTDALTYAVEGLREVCSRAPTWPQIVQIDLIVLAGIAVFVARARRRSSARSRSRD